jgi:hypothetical protein
MKTVREIRLASKKGLTQLSLVSDLFNVNGINMIGFHVSDERKGGGLRVVADDPDKAVNVLSTAGYDLSVAEVIACKLPDHPGGLNAILKPLKSANINVDTIYPCLGTGEGTILIMAIGPLREGLKVLEANWIQVYGGEFYSLY